MSFTKQLMQTFQTEYKGAKGSEEYRQLYKQRLIGYRKEPMGVVRVDKPTNIARARALGYKAKKGILIVRSRIRKGSGMHSRPPKGRRPKRMGTNKLTKNISNQGIAEQRASKKYPNCEVLNSYWVGEDGRNKYFEVILVDTQRPEIKSDKDLNWLLSKSQRGRAERGLTSAFKKSRGLRHKGKGAEKLRPSRNMNKKRRMAKRKHA